MQPRRWLFAVASAASAGAAAVAFAASAPARAQDGPRAGEAPACTDGTTVRTDKGPVCGTAGSGVRSWLGVPYAAPPVGDLRWAPTAPPAGWTSTLEATRRGSACPQPPGLGPGSTSEDCLKLDITAPEKTDGKPLPVMVELHGGGFRLGSPSDGTHLVKEGGVINVGVQYRLGIFGFMAHEGFGRHAGNYALRDQQAALRWVQRNIARFGGDPRNVTIYGASAGGSSVCANTASPAAKGLFQKGIAQSGEYNSLLGVDVQWQAQDCKAKLPSEEDAQKAGERFAAALGCKDAACLRALPVDALLKQAGNGIGPDAGTQGPVVDGEILPMSPGRAFAEGKVNKVALMHGVDRDEVQLPSADTPEKYRENVRRQYGPLASRVMELYPLERFPAPSAFIAYRTIVADSNSVCPALLNDERLAEHIPVFAYQTDNADAPPMFFLDPTKPNGSYHVSESPFLSPFPGGAELTANQKAFGAQLTAQWTGFARTGNPTVDGTPYWPRFTRHDPAVLSLVPAGDSQVTHEIAEQHHCGFWNRHAPFREIGAAG
ncbi:carboxylesterase/lipase family protein [Actinomadura luteofluorescens]|uniref:carboxylesterase/lipase family protein n=1 Tax=Actinomadura luteofluorescens TaxID=46163 RepID=UPI0021643885|nr:carboxylesterase family protein [Actinomadura glauciflava]MCR3739866.1 para-nitrobenzyl esterase [Actinomadura glauciflava]